tara:strand:+ start:426 stop:818 length:393 start_codon:yes stop_codon:yes gene_type:complete
MSQKQFSGNVYYLDPDSTASTATLTGRQYFHTLVNGKTDISITVKGGGMFEYVASVTDDTAAAKYIDPLTGAPFADKDIFDDADHGAGFYEIIATAQFSIGLGKNQIVCGRFTEVSVTGSTNAEIMAYTG